jgi:putative methionine-R-sulfoxide reductase with GAF domain
VSTSLDELADRVSEKLLRWRWIAASTLGVAGFSFWLGKASGWWYLPSAMGVLVFGLIAASITWARDRQVRLETEKAVSVARRLWATLTGAGLPVIKALGDICARAKSTASYDPGTALLTHVLDATRLRLGDDTTSNRSAFYERTSADTLTLVQWAGRHGPPRHQEWRRDDIPVGQGKLNFLDGTGGPFEDVPDVAKANLHGFVPTDAGYVSYLTVRVVAGGETFGLLCVDSPVAGNFTERDKNALALLAGLLAAGLAAASKQ